MTETIDCDRVPHVWVPADEDPWECPPPVERLEDGSGDAVAGALASRDADTHVYGIGEYHWFGMFVAATNLDDDPADELIVTAGNIDAGYDIHAFIDPPPLGRMAVDTISTVHIHEPSSTFNFNWHNSTADLDGDGRAEYQAEYNGLYYFDVPIVPGDYAFKNIDMVMQTWADGLYQDASAEAFDATDDGVRDLWISCPLWDPQPEFSVNGRACLIAGPLEGYRPLDTIGDFAARYYEETNDVRSGTVLARDFDGDGTRDVLVNGLGYGPDLGGLVSLITDPPLVEASYESVTTHTIEGSPNEALSLTATYDPGDIDGDGYEDLFLSVGIQYVLPGSNGFVVFYGPLTQPTTHSDCADVRYTADEPFELQHDTVVSGDFDGDGHQDLSVGAYGEQWLFYGPLPSGNHDMDDADATIGAVGFDLGDSSAAGDLDGDGIDDLVLGARQHTNFDEQDGSVFVFYGGRDL